MGQIKALSMLSKEPSTRLINDYFQWLCGIVRVDQGEKSYFLLAKTLHKKEFFWTVPNDDNRAADGKKLREIFAEENDCLFPEAFAGGPCSLFEMLIALSKRMEDFMFDPEKGDRTSHWFWEILGNLGLDKYSDDQYYDLHGLEYIEETLTLFLERGYRRNGKGGLFPLKNAKKDQRKVEIWYQMSTYLLENYYIDGKIL